MAVMTNMASLILPDAKSTPENHTFLPASNGADGIVRWQDREHNSGISLGFSTLTFSVREPVKTGGVSRVKITLSVPKLDTSTVVPTIAGVGTASAEYIFPGTYTLQDRVDLKTIFGHALSSTLGLGDNTAQMQRPY